MADPRAQFVISAQDKASAALKKIKGEVGGLGQVFSKFNVAIGGLVGGGALTLFVKNSLDAADRIQKLNQRLGASTEALSQYQFVADQTGVSFNQLTTGWQRMTRRIAEAAQGTGEAKNALAELGLDVQKLNQLKPEEQFEVLADAIMKVKNPADQVRLAMKLFDSEGVALLQTMQGGSESIRKLRDEADKLGLTLDQDTANAAARANDAMDKFGAATDALGVHLTAALAPAIEDVANWLQDTIPGAVEIARDAFAALQQFIQQTGGFISRSLGSISGGLAAAADTVGADILGRALQRTADDYNNAAKIFEGAADRIKRARVEIEASPAGSVQGGSRIGEIFSASIKPVTEASKAAKKASDDFAKSLQSLIDKLDPTGAATREYVDNVALLDRAWTEGIISAERYQELLTTLATDVDALREAEEALAKDRERAGELIKGLDPGASIRDQIFEVQRLRDAFPELSDALADVELELQTKWDSIGDQAKDAADKTKTAWEELGPTFSSAFEDAIVAGKKFSDVLKGLEQDILRIVTRNLVTKPLGDAISGMFGGGGGGSNFLSGIFGSLFGFADGGTFSIGDQFPKIAGRDDRLVMFRGNLAKTYRSPRGAVVAAAEIPTISPLRYQPTRLTTAAPRSRSRVRPPDTCS